MNGYLIGTDIGTTGTKSMLFSGDGKLLAHAYAAYPMQTPSEDRCEQRAEDWWDALVQTVREVVAAANAGDKIAAISLSLQGGTLVPVDAGLRPLRPAIVWSDKRCAEEAARFATRFGDAYLYEKTGWNLSAGLNAMQIAWLRENEPDVFSSTDKFLSVPDYISAKLTGRAAVDISDAGINQLADIRAGAYDPAILDFAGVSERQLGEIVPSGAVIGELTAEAKATLGLTGKVVLVAGAHDQYAALLGAGVTEAGDVLIGTGTAWVVTALTDCPRFETGFAQSVSAAPGKWGSLVSLSTGGLCLDWLHGSVTLGVSGSEKIPYAALDAEAMRRAPGSMMFFPYFSGASYPSRDERAKASFVGLDLSHDRFDMARAVMEGVAFQTVWTLGAFGREYGLGRVMMSGGATKSAVWTQIVADIAARPIVIPATPDLTCVGAAILAGVGCGAFVSVEEGHAALAIEERTVEPTAQAEQYAALLPLFQRRAQALSTVYAL